MLQSLREAKGHEKAAKPSPDIVRAAERELPALDARHFRRHRPCAWAAALNIYGVRRVVLVGLVTELPAAATDYLVGVIQRSAMWSRFDAVAVNLAPKRRSRGLLVAAIHRFVMPADWSAKR